MQIQEDIPLAPLTSFRTGGHAKKLITITNTSEIESALDEKKDGPLWILGYGTNVLISDHGLPGTTLLMRNNSIELNDLELIADAGGWWDDTVKLTLKQNFWGIELMCGIPGSVGAAVSGNVAAYGQSASNSLKWVEVINITNHQVQKIESKNLGLNYRTSDFYTDKLKDHVILRACFKLEPKQTQKLEYQSALNIAKLNNLNPNDLHQRQKIIMKAREAAGSLYFPSQNTQHHSVGSFFKNPLVSQEKAEYVISFEENKLSKNQIKRQNKIHGGNQARVSAAHIMLAAGFRRGQTWGNVRLHPDHLLKLENIGGASAQEIYNVSSEIIQTVKDKLDIDLEPETRFLGKFD